MPSSDKVFKYCIRLHTKMQSWESLSYYLMRLARVKTRGKSEGTWGCVYSTETMWKKRRHVGMCIQYSTETTWKKLRHVGMCNCVYSTETTWKKRRHMGMCVQYGNLSTEVSISCRLLRLHKAIIKTTSTRH